MSDRYCVFGNPVAHSRSPAIHARFAVQTRQDVVYEAILAPLDGFAASVRAFVEAGGRGANVTVPFKEEAHRLANRLTPRAERAGAVNTLVFDSSGMIGDNTDGAGLLNDIERNLNLPLAGKRVLLLGAGGAARGVLAPLLDAGPRELMIANRSADKARALAAGAHRQAHGGSFDEITGSFDIVINATSASLAGASLPLPLATFAADSLAYDMMYGRDTPFLAFARSRGAAHCADGLGMLVEQAAEAFYVWRGVRPETAPVLADLRAA
ncbi:MAG TPA: shikimate dehydrogenase [Rhodocyclaceae bacterium]|nr:shikimate dehydrogenase [Rhodocyclaceae bacterium]